MNYKSCFRSTWSAPPQSPSIASAMSPQRAKAPGSIRHKTMFAGKELGRLVRSCYDRKTRSIESMRFIVTSSGKSDSVGVQMPREAQSITVT